MKTAPVSLSLRYMPVLMLVLGAVFFALPVHADTLAQQLDKSQVYVNNTTTGNYAAIDLPVGLFAGRNIDSVTFNTLGANGSSRIGVELRCWLDAAATQVCPGVGTGTGGSAFLIDTPSGSGQSDYTAYFRIGDLYNWLTGVPIASTTLPVVYDHAQIRLVKNAGAGNTMYGNAAVGFNGAQPYYIIIGSVKLDWTGVNATSTALTALYQAGASSTLNIIQARCTGTGGGIFGEALCATIAFLFVPDPTIMNGYAALPASISQRFPVNYVAGVASAFNSLSASSTSNMITVTLPFHSLGVGTSTPLGLANIVSADVDAFSTSTIEHYIGTTYWALFQTLIALAMWLTFGADVFFTVRNQMHRV